MDQVVETRKEVLLIENHPESAMLIGSILEEMGMWGSLEAMGDCRSALAHLRKSSGNRPLLILLDIEMPQRGAFDFLEAVKADPTLRVIPVVILAPDPADERVAACYAAGAVGYLVRSATRDDFAGKLRSACEYWALSRVPMV